MVKYEHEIGITKGTPVEKFVAGNFEYEYEVDATTGAILDASKEQIGFNAPVLPDPNSNEYIGEESAKQIAYDNAGVNEVSFVRVHLDSDDGIVYYDVEFRSGDYEYNYDVDAKTGDLLEKDIDKELYAIWYEHAQSAAVKCFEYLDEHFPEEPADVTKKLDKLLK